MFVGMKHGRYGELVQQPNAEPRWQNMKKLPGLIDANSSIETNDNKVYTDDVISFMDVNFKSGTLDMELGMLFQKNFAVIGGHAYLSATLNETTIRDWAHEGANDVPPRIGIGYVATAVLEDNTKVYYPIFFPCCQASAYNREEKTAEEDKDYTSYNLSFEFFSILRNKKPVWRIYNKFDTEDKALAWLEGVIFEQNYEVEFDLNGGQGEIAPLQLRAGVGHQINVGQNVRPPESQDDNFITKMVGYVKALPGQVIEIVAADKEPENVVQGLIKKGVDTFVPTSAKTTLKCVYKLFPREEENN